MTHFSTRLLIVIVFAIVVMGITNTMTTVIFERFREFGILNAIGAGPGGIVSLVILESFFLGAIATVLGSLAGIAACFYLQQYGIDLFSALQQQYHTTFVFSSHDQA